MAVWMAQEDEQSRRDKQRERKAARRLHAQQAAQDKELDELGAIIKDLADAVFIANGFHQHKREWRRKRQ